MMNQDNIEGHSTPAEKLKSQIKEFEKHSGHKLYTYLPEEEKKILSLKAFNQNINRMENNQLLHNSKLLYEVLKTIGISYESLFSEDSSDTRIANYLNSINQKLNTLEKNQEHTNELLQKHNKGIQHRSTIIRKLDILNHNYLILYQEKENNFSNIFEKFISEILSYKPNRLNSEINKVINSLESKYEKGLYPGNEDIMLSSLCINYLLLLYLKNFISCYVINRKTQKQLEKNYYDELLSTIVSVMTGLSKTIVFVSYRKNVKSHIYFPNQSSYKQLCKTLDFIKNLIAPFYSLWNAYYATINSKSYNNQSDKIKSDNNNIINCIKYLKNCDLRKTEDRDNAILFFKSTATSLFFTPKAQLNYERTLTNRIINIDLNILESKELFDYKSVSNGFMEEVKNFYSDEETL